MLAQGLTSEDFVYSKMQWENRLFNQIFMWQSLQFQSALAKSPACFTSKEIILNEKWRFSDSFSSLHYKAYLAVKTE